MAFSNLLALAALASANPAGAGQARLSTPPLPPGVVCGGQSSLDLGAIPLTAETTLAQVVAAWGEPRRGGPANEIYSYYLTCDARLWLSFEPDDQRRLTRAILFTGNFVPAARVILDDLQVTRRRRCSQVPNGRGRSGRRIFEAWGPPDNEIGSGLVRWTYEMADGGLAQVFPEGNDRYLVGCSSGRSTG
jgi:hypothetical protein